MGGVCGVWCRSVVDRCRMKPNKGCSGGTEAARMIFRSRRSVMLMTGCFWLKHWLSEGKVWTKNGSSQEPVDERDGEDLQQDRVRAWRKGSGASQAGRFNDTRWRERWKRLTGQFTVISRRRAGQFNGGSDRVGALRQKQGKTPRGSKPCLSVKFSIRY